MAQSSNKTYELTEEEAKQWLTNLGFDVFKTKPTWRASSTTNNSVLEGTQLNSVLFRFCEINSIVTGLNRMPTPKTHG